MERAGMQRSKNDKATRSRGENTTLCTLTIIHGLRPERSRVHLGGHGTAQLTCGLRPSNTVLCQATKRNTLCCNEHHHHYHRRRPHHRRRHHHHPHHHHHHYHNQI